MLTQANPIELKFLMGSIALQLVQNKLTSLTRRPNHLTTVRVWLHSFCNLPNLALVKRLALDSLLKPFLLLDFFRNLMSIED